MVIKEQFIILWVLVATAVVVLFWQQSAELQHTSTLNTFLYTNFISLILYVLGQYVNRRSSKWKELLEELVHLVLFWNLPLKVLLISSFKLLNIYNIDDIFSWLKRRMCNRCLCGLYCTQETGSGSSPLTSLLLVNLEYSKWDPNAIMIQQRDFWSHHWMAAVIFTNSLCVSHDWFFSDHHFHMHFLTVQSSQYTQDQTRIKPTSEPLIPI